MATIEQVLKAVAPKADQSFLAATSTIDVAGMMRRFGIDDARSQAQLIGHMAVESGGFKTFSENLNYSAERLHQVWPNRFPSVEAAAPYAHNPQRLAEKVYNGRMGNRPDSHDGWEYRGSGTLQHTGRSEFERVQKRTGESVLAFPALLRDPLKAKAMWLGACSYFVDRGALPFAKVGDTRGTTKKINGGFNGLADREVCVARALRAIGASPIEATLFALPEPATANLPPMPPADAPQTTAEVADDAKRNRDTALIAGTTLPPAAGGATKALATHDWFVIGGVMILGGIIAFVVVRALWGRSAQAKSDVETLQLLAIQQKLAQTETSK